MYHLKQKSAFRWLYRFNRITSKNSFKLWERKDMNRHECWLLWYNKTIHFHRNNLEWHRIIRRKIVVSILESYSKVRAILRYH